MYAKLGFQYLVNGFRIPPMGRPRKPVTVIARKSQRFWYWKTEYHDSYMPTPVEVRRNPAGKPTNRHEAEEWAYGAHLKAIHQHGQNAALTYRRILADAWIVDRDPRLVELFTDWNGKGRPPVGYQYIKEARSLIERLILADPIADTKPTDGVEPWVKWKARQKTSGASARTINEAKKHASTVLNYMVTLGRIGSNPAAAVSAMEEDVQETGIFTAGEVAAIVANPAWCDYYLTRNGKRYRRDVESDRMRPERYAMIILALATTARPGELLRIRWRDVDMDGATLYLADTKSRKPRTVPLARQAVAALQAFQKHDGVDDPDAYVFRDGDKPRSGKFYSAAVKEIMRNGKLPERDPDGRIRRPYSLKHSMLTLLIEHDVSPLDAAHLAGHSRESAGRDYSLTAVQKRYVAQRLERLRDKVVPVIELILEPPDGDNVVRFRRDMTG